MALTISWHKSAARHWTQGRDVLRVDSVGRVGGIARELLGRITPTLASSKSAPSPTDARHRDDGNARRLGRPEHWLPVAPASSDTAPPSQLPR
jgi:hypothetical protein